MGYEHWHGKGAENSLIQSLILWGEMCKWGTKITSLMSKTENKVEILKPGVFPRTEEHRYFIWKTAERSHLIWCSSSACSCPTLQRWVMLHRKAPGACCVKAVLAEQGYHSLPIAKLPRFFMVSEIQGTAKLSYLSLPNTGPFHSTTSQELPVLACCQGKGYCC